LFHQPASASASTSSADRHYIERIVAAVDPQSGDVVVEIGPGLGALTRPCSSGVERLHVVEIDRDLARG